MESGNAPSTQAEDVLKEYAVKLEQAMSAANMAWWEMDVPTGNVAFDPRKAKMLGYPPEKFSHYQDFVGLVHPDDAENAMNAMRGHFQGRYAKYECEYRIMASSGEYLWFRDIGEIVRRAPNGMPLKVTGTVIDITERKQVYLALSENESKQRAMLSNIADVIAIVDDGAAISFISENIEKLFGWTPDELLGLPHTKTAHRDDVERVRAATAKLMAEENASTTIEYRFEHKNGTFRVIHLTAMNLMHVQSIRGVLVNFHDITELKNSEQILRDVQRRESIGILSSGLAHDFNNLLGTMMGNISLAQIQLPADHPVGQNIEKALAAMEHAADLTKQMLAYAGKGKLETRSIDLAAMVSEHIRLFSVSLPKNVKLKTCLSSTPVCIVGDASQIEQVVMNLIINGGDSIGDKPGSVSVDVSAVHMAEDDLVAYGVLAGRKLSEGEYALLSVADTGMGMSADTQAKIFDPFFTTKFSGHGLGLSAVLGIINGHKGGIAIASVVGKGTTFHVLLPIIQAAPPVEERRCTEADAPAVHEITILIIDDEEDLAATAQEMLESGRHTAWIELNPVRGIELYQRRHADIGLVLLDLTMPEMSGKDVVGELQAINPDVKIIISSGYSEDDVMKKIGHVQVSGFIQKPYRLQSLLALVESAVRRS